MRAYKTGTSYRGVAVSSIAQLSDAEERMLWRRSLPDDILRSLASDFLRGLVDECNADAFAEFEYRYGAHVKGAKRIAHDSKAAKRKRAK